MEPVAPPTGVYQGAHSSGLTAGLALLNCGCDDVSDSKGFRHGAADDTSCDRVCEVLSFHPDARHIQRLVGGPYLRELVAAENRQPFVRVLEPRAQRFFHGTCV